MLSSERVRSVLDSAPDAMVIIENGTVVFANRQVTALFGYRPDELVGQEVECLLPERFRARHAGHRERYVANLRVRPMGSGLDLFALRKDGSEFPVEISLSPGADTAHAYIVAAIRDITDRRRIQLELRQAREAAERANQAKSRFLATASHDLRQPLQALALLNGTMRRMVGEGDLAEPLLQEQQAIEAMSHLLNALLDISKLESGAIRPEITDFKVAALFEELRNEFATLATSKGLRLEVEFRAERIRSDPSLVGQVVRNLLSNAIKYTSAGTVHLRCSQDSRCVKLEVLDTGIGIPAHELSHIFDDFYQVGVASNTARDGYGLGLSIVSRIATLLGARVEVRSEVGKGTQFSVALPASHSNADVATAQRHGQSCKSAGGTRAHLLFVEDDPRVRKAMTMLLNVEGFRVEVAATVREALEHAANHPDIRLLITDYHLDAGETGMHVLEKVRSRLGNALPAVVVTGDTSTAMHTLAVDPRVRMAAKPINPDELLDLVRELLAS